MHSGFGSGDNPLFGSLASPSPAGLGSTYNPLWSSPATASAFGAAAGLRAGAPSSVRGMRRLAALPPSQLGAGATRHSNDDLTLDEDVDEGQPGFSSLAAAAAAEEESPGLAGQREGSLPPPPPTATATLQGPLRTAAQQQPILPTSATRGSGVAGAVPSLAAPPPGAVLAARDRPEEQAFAEALGAVMRGELDAAEALTQYAAICRQQASNLREAASSQLQRAARYLTLQEAAGELDGEASTWHLMWHLHGVASRDFPGGRGGNFVEGAGLTKTRRQRVSDLLFQDDALNRCGRTVAWLEFLAGEALDRDPGVPFASTDGVWRETRSRLASGAVTAGGRGGGGAFGGGAGGARDAGGAGALLVSELDPDAPTRQRRRLDSENAKGEEMLTAHLWKLVRAGRVSAARQLCEDVGQPWRAASLAGAGGQGPVPLAAAADEADDAAAAWEQPEDMAAEVEGGAVLRALWRWSCLQLAERVGAGAEQAGGGLHEAAIYAALASHLARVLPVCTSWEDVCWAYLRCWLDLAVDARLGMDADPEGALPGCEAALAELAGGAEVAGEGLDVAKGVWPLDRLRAALPPSFEAALEAADSAGAPGGGGSAASGQRFRGLQSALILDQVEALVRGTLVDWVLQGSSSQAALLESPTRGAQPSCPPGLMRFAAHLALSLWALDIARVPQDGRPSAAYEDIHDVLHKVVQVYVIHLIDSGAHDLVPLYACHLRAGLRHMTYQIFFEQLVAQSSMEACRQAYRLADTWFDFWQGRGDVAPQEMATIATKVVGRSRYEVVGGPQQRARFARWLCFGQSTLGEALRHANLLCREFALGGSGGIAAASSLLSRQLPAALGVPLEELLLAMEAGGGGGEVGSAQQGEDELAAQAAELRSWALYYEYEVEFGAWQELYSDTMQGAQAGDDPRTALEESAALAKRTLPLLTAMMSYLHQGWLESLVTGGVAAAVGGPPTEVVLAVGPERGPLAEAEVQGGDAFPTFPSAEALEGAARGLRAALGAIAATQEGLQFVVAPGPEGMEGLLTVAAKCGGPSALDACIVLLALAVKGCLQGAEGVGPLVVVNVDAPPTVTAALCRCMCYPRVVLKCGALREALAFMGHSGTEGDELAEVVAGGAGGAGGLAMYFSQPELQELLQFERAATVLQMRNAEEAERAQQADSQEQ